MRGLDSLKIVYNLIDLNDLIGINTDLYTLLIGTPDLKDSTLYDVEIKIIDKYNQEISKSVQYNLVTE